MSAYDWDTMQAHHHRLQQQHQQQQHFAAPTTAVDECGLRPDAKGAKRSRQTYSKYQTAVLETVFQTSKYIVRSKRQQMSAELELTERQIKIWFQNRRMKEKKCHKGVPRIDDDGRRRPAAATNGYVDEYASAVAGPPPGGPDYLAVPSCDDSLPQDGDAALADYLRPAPCKIQDDGGCYAGYAGYELQLTPEPDPYGGAAVKQQWPPTVAAMDFHQDLFADHDFGHFQRLPMTHNHHHHHHHHHRSLNSQVPGGGGGGGGGDYCPPAQMQLAAAHGF